MPMPTPSRSRVRRISAAASAPTSSSERRQGGEQFAHELQLTRPLGPGEELETRDHRGPELTPVEFEGDPIRHRGSALPGSR
jgi:hypothetical protein